MSAVQALDSPVLEHPLHEPYSYTLLCVDGIVQVLRELEAQAVSDNVSSVRQSLDDVELTIYLYCGGLHKCTTLSAFSMRHPLPSF
jgi:hypothetical protein